MYGKEADTIGSYNKMLREQQQIPGKAYITTALFGDECEILCCHTPVGYAGELTAKDYFVKGNTALYDAVGKVFSVVTDSLHDMSPAYEKKVAVFIITDGMENASVRWRAPEIRTLIAEKRKKGWKIVFSERNRNPCGRPGKPGYQNRIQMYIRMTGAEFVKAMRWRDRFYGNAKVADTLALCSLQSGDIMIHNKKN